MSLSRTFETKAKALIDDLKAVCANHGLGNDGNEATYGIPGSAAVSAAAAFA
ncbi:MAG: hypothetical protein RL260_3365, partial [Pseudomonadota bacterium]